MKIKEILRGLIFGLFACLIIYILFAFGAGSFDTSSWHDSTRDFAATSFFLAITLGQVASFTIESLEK